MIDNIDLSQKQCQACQAGAPQVDRKLQLQLLQQIPEWNIVSIDGIDRLRRSFSFPDFRSALIFTQCIGELGETLEHHPEIVTAWGKVTVFWWTHKIVGLHLNDFIAAAKTDKLYQ